MSFRPRGKRSRGRLTDRNSLGSRVPGPQISPGVYSVHLGEDSHELRKQSENGQLEFGRHRRSSDVVYETHLIKSQQTTHHSLIISEELKEERAAFSKGKGRSRELIEEIESRLTRKPSPAIVAMALLSAFPLNPLMNETEVRRGGDEKREEENQSRSSAFQPTRSISSRASFTLQGYMERRMN